MDKIAVLTTSVSRNAGGLYESVRYLSKSLIQRGMDIQVYGVTDQYTDRDLHAWYGVNVSTSKALWKGFGYSPEYFQKLRAFNPSLIHTHGIWLYPSVATNRQYRAAKTPYVISPRGMLDPWLLRRSRLKKWLAFTLYEGKHLKNASCLHALCWEEAHAFRQIGLTNPICVIPNGVDVGKIEAAQADGNESWNNQIKAGQKVLLYLGRIHPKKGLINLIKAWAQFPKQEDWLLAIAGWDQGEHQKTLQELAASLDADSTIVFLGPRFDQAKASVFRNCDAFILPSFGEGLPMVVLEAWAHGKPVLMTPECNLSEGFPAGAALRIEANQDAIAQGLSKLFTMSDDERSRMGMRGYELAKNKFSWGSIGDQMRSVYEWILRGGEKPQCVYTK